MFLVGTMLQIFSGVRFPAIAAGVAVIFLAACQTTNVNLKAGPGSTPTPIIVSSTLPSSHDDMGIRISSTHYYYINGGSDGEKAARLGVGLAFGVIGVAANMAVVRANSEREVVALQTPFSQATAAFSAARIASALPHAQVAAAGDAPPAMRSSFIRASCLMKATA
jgi:hypothetical protein